MQDQAASLLQGARQDSTQGSPDLRFEQKQDSAAAFSKEAILRKTMPNQVNTELKLRD
jgi:hypothetical protein